MKNDNSKKIIFDLCGGTGAWSKPYKDAGYQVEVITLPEFDVTSFEFRTPEDEMYLFFRNAKGNRTGWLVKDIYAILAAPPCTMFSRARSTGGPRDFEGAMKTVRACMEIVWGCKTYGNLTFWALENPMGLLRKFLGNPAVSVQPWWFGDLHSKQTDLWGYFNTPKRIVTQKPMLIDSCHGNSKHWSNPKKPSEYKHLKLNRAGIRAITPECFAKAFYKANK